MPRSEFSSPRLEIKHFLLRFICAEDSAIQELPNMIFPHINPPSYESEFKPRFITISQESTRRDTQYKHTLFCGWRGINNYHKEETDDDPDAMEQVPSFVVNETLLVQGYALSARKTTPRPLYTEATLLDAMETVGRDPSE